MLVLLHFIIKKNFKGTKMAFLMPKFCERFVTFATIVLEKIAKLLHAFKMKIRAKKE